MKKNKIVVLSARQLILIFILLSLSFCRRGEQKHKIIQPASISVEDIVTIREIPNQHKVFQARFLPEIHIANNNVLRERNILLEMIDSLEYNDKISENLFSKLNTLFTKYRYQKIELIEELPADSLKSYIERLMVRVDIVPVRLVMAQAIIESGWGTSDFAREGNNYFGIRCYTEGCGIAPDGVDSVTFYLKMYPNEMASIEDYLRTMNTHYAYESFRQKRAELRANSQPLESLELLGGIDLYSEKRDEYISMVSNIIRNYIPENTMQLLLGGS